MNIFNELKNKNSNIMSKDNIIKIIDKYVNDCISNGYTNEYIREYMKSKNKIQDTDISKLNKTFGMKFDNEQIMKFWMYKLYVQRNIDDRNIINIMMINERDTDRVEINGITYEWNRVKSELNKLKHNLDFINAIDLIRNPKSQTFITDTDRRLTFGFQFNGVFMAVNIEMLEAKTIRIISYFETTEERWKLIKSKYEMV